MRILVHEFANGGGFAGRPVPRSLAREGRAMLTALVADLSALRCHDIVATRDPRFRPILPPRVDVVAVGPGQPPLPRELLSTVDAVWLIAPETGGCLEWLAATVECAGKTLLGTGSRAIRRAADKADLPRRLAQGGVLHPRTRVVRAGEDARAAAEHIGYPLVVKPSHGAGCCGVSLARNPRELGSAIAVAAAAVGNAGLRTCATESGMNKMAQRPVNEVAQDVGPAIGRLLLQEYIRGMPASVSLLCDGRRAVALSINAQALKPGRAFAYRGGRTPLDHALATRAIEAACRACEALSDLRGYVGVDLVLTDRDPVIIEVNPRLTTSYLGVRAAMRGTNGDGNIAAMAIGACGGTLPGPLALRRSVRFTSAGRVVVER